MKKIQDTSGQSILDLSKSSRPDWIIGENVAGHIKLGLDTVLKNLESEGYSARTFSISASSVGANHQRERIWIVAHSQHNSDQQQVPRSDGEEKKFRESIGRKTVNPGNLAEQIQYGNKTTDMKMWRTPDNMAGDRTFRA